MKMLPILSTVTVRPAPLAHETTRSRPLPSASLTARRHTPPFGVAPTFASSMSEPQSRSPFTRSPFFPLPVELIGSSSGALHRERTLAGGHPGERLRHRVE